MHELHRRRRLRFPMYVMRISDFVQLRELRPHNELLRRRPRLPAEPEEIHKLSRGLQARMTSAIALGLWSPPLGRSSPITDHPGRESRDSQRAPVQRHPRNILWPRPQV